MYRPPPSPAQMFGAPAVEATLSAIERRLAESATAHAERRQDGWRRREAALLGLGGAAEQLGGLGAAGAGRVRGLLQGMLEQDLQVRGEGARAGGAAGHVGAGPASEGLGGRQPLSAYRPSTFALDPKP